MEVTSHADCINDIRAFVLGGNPGLSRLKQVLPSIFKHHNVTSIENKTSILEACSLVPFIVNKDLTFRFQPEPPGL